MCHELSAQSSKKTPKMPSQVVSLCTVDAAAVFHPSAAEWRRALAAVPEQKERTKITSYRPPRGVQLHEHYNPRSVLFGRHLLRGMLLLAQREREEETTPANTNSNNDQSAVGRRCSVLKNGADVRCGCCKRHVTPLLRTFEGRPCVASDPCSCHLAAATTMVENSGNSSQHDLSFIEDRPNVNLSHNNGVVAVATIPTMVAANADYASSNAAAAAAAASYVLGVDVMCIDTVPTSMRNGDLDSSSSSSSSSSGEDDDDDSATTKKKKCGGLDQYFTPNEVGEFLELMQSYMTEKEWRWINGGSRSSNTQQNDDESVAGDKKLAFAKKFYDAFEARRKHCYPPPGCSATIYSTSGQFLRDPRNIVNLYRLWRFLVIWTLKEAVLKAAGIGLGFDTTAIQIEFASSADIDDEAFYSMTTAATTTASYHQSLLSPLKHVRISVTVPSVVGLEPGGVFEPQFFDSWLVLNTSSMSVTAAVLAPAFVSKWSGHSQFVFKRALDDDDHDDGVSTAERERVYDEKIRQWIVAVREQMSSSDSSRAEVYLRLLNWKSSPNQQKHGLSSCAAEQNNAEQTGSICCGCCVAKNLV